MLLMDVIFKYLAHVLTTFSSVYTYTRTPNLPKIFLALKDQITY
jgi:hypothetical protein